MTNILAVGDLHLRKTAPALRKDNYYRALCGKLQAIFAIAKEHDCRLVVFPGDIFDRFDAPYSLVEMAIREFQSHNLQYLFVFGQHDLRYHTGDKQNTPLGCLVAALNGQGHVLTPDSGISLDTGPFMAVFRGVSWGESIPEHIDSEFPVLVMHKTITMQPLPWGDGDIIQAKDLVKMSNAKLFITGDNHAQFIAKYKAGIVLNMGSVMRSSIAQIEHKPAVAVVGIGERCSVLSVPLPIEDDVFDAEQVEAKKDMTEQVDAFLAGLGSEFDPELNFIENLRLAAKECPPGVRDLIRDVLE